MTEIRKVEKGELEKMQRFEENFVGSDESFEDFRERYEKWPETFVVYIEDGEIIGEASGNMEGEKMGVQAIGVREGYKGEGIGSKVLNFFEQKARKYSEKVTVASADNVEEFYRANGYSPVEILIQVEKEKLPEGYREGDRIVREKEVGEDTIFLYADFDEYSEELRDILKEKFNAFEVNTIYEKNITQEN
jgi:amino-acid N-acetyltransferase